MRDPKSLAKKGTKRPGEVSGKGAKGPKRCPGVKMIEFPVTSQAVSLSPTYPQSPPPNQVSFPPTSHPALVSSSSSSQDLVTSRFI